MRRETAFNKLSAILLFGLISGNLPAQSNAASVPTIAPLPQVVRDIDKIKQRQLVAFNPRYLEEKSNFVARFRPVGRQVFAMEAAGKDVQCGHDIFAELVWLVSVSGDVKRMNLRLRDLETSLAPDLTNSAGKSNGLPCVTEWWERLEWAYDHVKSDEPIPPDILAPFNSPEKLTALLTSLSVSDIARTGRDNGWEFNMTCADLLRWIVRDRPKDKAFHPKLKETMLDLVTTLQDADTGYWGQRYVIDGTEQFVPDLSTTFHIVSYLKGEVPRFDKVIATTLAVRDLDGPRGWNYQGQPWNHNYVDVVELFKWGWPKSSDRQKQAIAAGIEEMLHRCLTESLQPDGSFKRLEADASIEQAMYFGSEFLARTGYFDKSRRFWTEKDFPEAESVRQKIISYIKRQTGGAAGGSWYRDALNSLQSETKRQP